MLGEGEDKIKFPGDRGRTVREGKGRKREGREDRNRGRGKAEHWTCCCSLDKSFISTVYQTLMFI